MKYYLENFSENERKVISVSLDLCCANPVSSLYSYFDTARYHYDIFGGLDDDDIFWISVAVSNFVESFKKLDLSSVFHNYYFDIYSEADDFYDKLLTMYNEALSVYKKEPKQDEAQSEDREEPEQDEDQSEDNKEPEQDEDQSEDREEPEQDETKSEDNQEPEQDEAQSEDREEPEQDEAQSEDTEEPKQEVDHTDNMYVHLLFADMKEMTIPFNSADGICINEVPQAYKYSLQQDTSINYPVINYPVIQFR